MAQKEHSRVADAAAKAIADLSSTTFENSREHHVAMAVHGVGGAIHNLRWAWVDPKNHPHIAAGLTDLIEQRDHLSRLIENVEAFALARQAAE